jgi:hypothetical protein
MLYLDFDYCLHIGSMLGGLAPLKLCSWCYMSWSAGVHAVIFCSAGSSYCYILPWLYLVISHVVINRLSFAVSVGAGAPCPQTAHAHVTE